MKISYSQYFSIDLLRRQFFFGGLIIILATIAFWVWSLFLPINVSLLVNFFLFAFLRYCIFEIYLDQRKKWSFRRLCLFTMVMLLFLLLNYLTMWFFHFSLGVNAVLVQIFFLVIGAIISNTAILFFRSLNN